jgi:hypothetical protein
MSKLLAQQPIQQIFDAQVRRPLLHVNIVQSTSLDRADPSQIAPLALGLFSAKTIPYQLRKDCVLWGSDRTLNTITAANGDFLKYPTI